MSNKRKRPLAPPLNPITEKQLPQLRAFLDPIVEQVEVPGYIATDPVMFMYRYDHVEDRNLAGFLSALMAWGRRDIVMAKISDLLNRFGTGPADFTGNYGPADRRRLDGFRHRTFTGDDISWILTGLSRILHRYGTFETFWADCYRDSLQSGAGAGKRPWLSGFHDRFFEFIPEAPERVKKHIASPDKNSSCKRLWLFLRWTIRRNSEVDPGTMSFMPPSELMIPLDVHVSRFARMFGLLTRPANDWKAVTGLTRLLRCMDPDDPAKYDYALFGLGIRNLALPGTLVLNQIDP